VRAEIDCRPALHNMFFTTYEPHDILSAGAVWSAARQAPKRNAVLLIAGDKSGGGEKRFYRQLIAKADERFGDHLSRPNKKGT
jgi:hypothetical protein